MHITRHVPRLGNLDINVQAQLTRNLLDARTAIDQQRRFDAGAAVRKGTMTDAMQANRAHCSALMSRLPAGTDTASAYNTCVADPAGFEALLSQMSDASGAPLLAPEPFYKKTWFKVAAGVVVVGAAAGAVVAFVK